MSIHFYRDDAGYVGERRAMFADDTLDTLRDADAALAEARDTLADVSARLDALAEAVNEDPAGYTRHHVAHAQRLAALVAQIGDLAMQMKREVFK